MTKPPALTGQPNRVILYTTPDGKVTVDVFFQADNFWLPQRAMAELFSVKTPAISRHLKNIYESGELTPEATLSKMETVQSEGERQITRDLEFYNLDAVIAVGYRVNSSNAAATIGATAKRRRCSSRSFRTSCILRRRARRRPKSSMVAPTPKSPAWA